MRLFPNSPYAESAAPSVRKLVIAAAPWAILAVTALILLVALRA